MVRGVSEKNSQGLNSDDTRLSFVIIRIYHIDCCLGIFLSNVKVIFYMTNRGM